MRHSLSSRTRRIAIALSFAPILASCDAESEPEKNETTGTTSTVGAGGSGGRGGAGGSPSVGGSGGSRADGGGGNGGESAGGAGGSIATASGGNGGSPGTGGDGGSGGSTSAPLIEICNSSVEDPYTLIDMAVGADLLYLNIGYSGGCVDDHDFSLCWNNTFIATEPPQVDLVLSHNAHGDLCKVYLLKDLVFDLTPIKDAAEDPPGTIKLNLQEQSADYDY